MRLFFGIWPPAELAFALSELAVRIRPLSGGRVTPAPNIHMTLAFLGELPAERVSAALGAAGRARHASKKATIRLAEVRYWKKSGIVWTGPTQPPEELVALADRLRVALEAEGFALEARPFAAHVTLLRKARPPGPLPPPPEIEWPVCEFVLVRSEQTKEGSAYLPIERFAL